MDASITAEGDDSWGPWMPQKPRTGRSAAAVKRSTGLPSNVEPPIPGESTMTAGMQLQRRAWRFQAQRRVSEWAALNLRPLSMEEGEPAPLRSHIAVVPTSHSELWDTPFSSRSREDCYLPLELHAWGKQRCEGLSAPKVFTECSCRPRQKKKPPAWGRAHQCIQRSKSNPHLRHLDADGGRRKGLGGMVGSRLAGKIPVRAWLARLRLQPSHRAFAIHSSHSAGWPRSAMEQPSSKRLG